MSVIDPRFPAMARTDPSGENAVVSRDFVEDADPVSEERRFCGERRQRWDWRS